MKHVFAAVLCKSNNCHPEAAEAAESHAQASDSQRRACPEPAEGICVLIAESIGLIWTDGDKKGGLAMQCDKNDYRGILAGLEGVSGKKAVDSETITGAGPPLRFWQRWGLMPPASRL